MTRLPAPPATPGRTRQGRLRLATRGSPLARAQTELVAARLVAAWPGLVVEPVIVRTEGDRRAAEPLEAIGGQGLFAKEVQAAVADGKADVAVHSAKDLPPGRAAPLALVAVPERADPRDALVGASLATLPTGAVVATGSARRRAQLAAARPDVGFVGLRGNMARRLAQVGVGPVAAVVAACAALDRLAWQGTFERLPTAVCLPQVGQGAIALECREDDDATRRLLEAVDDPDAHRTLVAERAFLAALGAGCTLPVAGWGERVGDAVRLHGLIASGDGRVVVRGALEGEEPDALGRALAHLLVVERGARSIEGWDGAPTGAGWAAGAPGALRR